MKSVLQEQSDMPGRNGVNKYCSVIGEGQGFIFTYNGLQYLAAKPTIAIKQQQ